MFGVGWYLHCGGIYTMRVKNPILSPRVLVQHVQSHSLILIQVRGCGPLAETNPKGMQIWGRHLQPQP